MIGDAEYSCGEHDAGENSNKRPRYVAPILVDCGLLTTGLGAMHWLVV